MSAGLENLKHVVVLMMNGRSFDHMLGGLKKDNARIDGLEGNESNRDLNGAVVNVQPLAEFQGQLDPIPDNRFSGVDVQIFGSAEGNNRVANMRGFIQSYYQQRRDIRHSRNVMYYFTPDKLPVLTTLASEFAVFNAWFSSIPGPTMCNRAFAHYGTSFGQVGTEALYSKVPIPSIYERMIEVGRTAKIYYYDQTSASMLQIVDLLKTHSELFSTYHQFLADCSRGTLPEYAFVEPNYTDHWGPDGEAIASDQYPDHNVQSGEILIASVYNAVRRNPELWATSAILIVYAQHGGIYDHVAPPQCTPDGYLAKPGTTGTDRPFAFDRLGVRVPAVLVSPWIPRGTIVSEVFEHASIPATVTSLFLGKYDNRTEREKKANAFLGVLTLPSSRVDADNVVFELGG